MWKISESRITDDEMNFLLVDTEDEGHWKEVDKPIYQVLEDIKLIFKD